MGFWNEVLHFPTTLNTIEFADEVVEEGVQQLGKLRRSWWTGLAPIVAARTSREPY